jgi:hypothetical protein
VDLAPVGFFCGLKLRISYKWRSLRRANKLRGHIAERYRILTKTQSLINSYVQYQRIFQVFVKAGGKRIQQKCKRAIK